MHILVRKKHLNKICEPQLNSGRHVLKFAQLTAFFKFDELLLQIPAKFDFAGQIDRTDVHSTNYNTGFRVKVLKIKFVNCLM
jgi:hypothetical protein